MKVKELIEVLKGLSPDKEIYVYDKDHDIKVPELFSLGSVFEFEEHSIAVFLRINFDGILQRAPLAYWYNSNTYAGVAYDDLIELIQTIKVKNTTMSAADVKKFLLNSKWKKKAMELATENKILNETLSKITNSNH